MRALQALSVAPIMKKAETLISAPSIVFIVSRKHLLQAGAFSFIS